MLGGQRIHSYFWSWLRDNYYPVAKIAFVHLFLVMAAIQHWPLHQLDIKIAFLHGELQVYMDQLPTFIVLGDSRLACRLCRSLYSLKQSPHAWFGCFNSALLQFGMTRCEADHSMFFIHSPSGHCIHLLSMLMTVSLLTMILSVFFTSNLISTISFKLKTWVCSNTS